MKKKITEEEKEKRRAYYHANKEALKIKMKAYYDTNKEDILIKQKVYHKANKDKRKAYYESKKLTHHVVYCLPKYNKHGYIKYAGVTDNPYHRMHTHKSEGKNTDEWFVLHECDTREEAEKIEAEYHEKGYAGKRGYKNK
tara:strand:- start:1016 stop:1435 length:420 start_codon:yes stop_codon:yes gene_type:complete